ncbi:hypothetical protein SEA_DARDANUS_59 [Gordonia phage Dardanus]|uniref:Uncharacterized protein n=1 Tax=Gordonia phage Dardanus TaxID=2588489 RepID=A0A514CX49_9CAUD|nr:hypothetical protein KDJ58_gp59 [Gordonia phage Dardanus]QDH85096.1 hypothetical protein SEA_DARDANUS_59 [Gordonia phage Dardanus]
MQPTARQQGADARTRKAIAEMVKCKVAQWIENDLDDDDRAALERRIGERFSMAQTFAAFSRLAPFKLTTWKDHQQQRCVCYRK